MSVPANVSATLKSLPADMELVLKVIPLRPTSMPTATSSAGG